MHESSQSPNDLSLLRARRQVFEGNLAVQLLIDPETGAIVEANPAACRFYGYTHEQLVSLRITDINTLAPSAVAAHMREAEAGEQNLFVFPHRLASGEVREVEVHTGPVELGGRRLLYSIVHDVTDRERAERALRESEEKYRTVLEAIEEAYYEVDLEGHLTFFNPALQRLLGFSAGEAGDIDCAAVLDPDNAARRQGYFATVLATGQTLRHAEWCVRRRDGGVRTVDSSISLMRDRQGQPIGFRGLLRDVTEQQAGQEALRESEERFRRLVEMSPDGIGVHTDGHFRFCNTVFARLMGARAPEEIVGRSVVEFVHPDSRGVVLERQRQLRDESEPVPFLEEKLVRLDGRVIDVEVAASPLTFRNQPAVQVVVRDITPRKEAERLQQALYRIAQTTSATHDMPAFYAAIHGIVGELMYARNFYIALRDEAAGRVRFEYFVDEEDPVAPEVAPGKKTLTEYVLRTGEPLLADEPVFEDLERRGEVDLVGSASVDWLGVPLKRGPATFGVLVVQSYHPERRFTRADRDLLTFVSQHVATAIDRKRAADALRESEARFRTLAETAPAAIFIHQDQGFRYANPALCAITGYSREELLRLTLWDLVHPDFAEEMRERGLVRERTPGVPAATDEFEIQRKDGSARWVEFSAGMTEVDGRPALLGSAFDITARKQAEEQIKKLAYHDSLTGLPNRLLFSDRLTLAVAQAHRHGQRLAVLFLDLDRFKVINDSLGHSAGDRLLQAVGERLSADVREGDTVARLGGDEFTLLLPDVSRAVDTAKVAEKLLEDLRHPFDLEGRELFVTASVGIALYPEDGGDAETLIKNADTAMYRAKEQGRDNYQLYTRAMNATAVERLALESSLRQALARRELLLHYQPLLDLGTGRVHGVEALLRWQHPAHGMIPPADFVPLAEVTGLIQAMGAWILRTACAQARAWQERGHPHLSVAVNLSARQFGQADLVEQIKQALEESGLAPRYLDLEITESNAMENAEATVHTLRELKALGVRVSIDDFGIGYSSLSYLKRLPIDTLKIDQSFVRDITTDPDDAAIATAVIALAHTLKLKVVAEGVESDEQLAFLAARHCDRVQGFLFSAALAPGECGAFLAANRPLAEIEAT